MDTLLAAYYPSIADNEVAQQAFKLGALSVLKEINQKLTEKTDAFEMLKIIDELNDRI